MSWEAFCKEMPPRSIAVDGFVHGPPRNDYQKLYFNFDHHDGPPRGAMLCSGRQVREAIHDGLLDLLMPTGTEVVHIWMNDCDPDVALCYFCFMHPWSVENLVNPALNRLFGHIDLMDKRSGLVDMHRGIPIVGQAAWVMQPYWEARFSGALDQKDPGLHMSVLESIRARINDFSAARPQSLPIDERYETLHEGARWAVVREHGPHARMAMARRGLRGFVSVRPLAGGKFYYTLCRYSASIYWFPLPEIAAHLNKGEPADGQFGGGDIVMGNARGPGSPRGPKEIFEAISAFLAQKNLTPP